VYNYYMIIPRFVVIDTETTGFANNARVLELGMVFCEEGQIVDSFGQRFRPTGVDWDHPSVQQALSVNGINPNDLIGQPDFSEVADHINMLFSRYDIWVGHHLQFDLRMIGNEYLRLGQQIRHNVTAMKVCTMEHDRLVHKHERSHKLADSAERYGVKLSNAHTAIGDATATAELFLAMYDEGKFGPVFMDRLHRFAAQEERRRADPGQFHEQTSELR
jgi:DNA polymerase III epsilon subunit-like protein